MTFADTALRPIILITVLFLFAPRLAPQPAAAAENREICAAAVQMAERANRVPRMLLHAVSLAEAGRWSRKQGESFAWPWTVNSGGEGKFYPDRAAAIDAVKRLQRKGVRNIDVGCMQINLMYHGDAFDSIEEAFDPAANTGYAARFLKDLRREAGTWAHAVARYHTRNWKERGQPYWRKVRRLWNAERRRDYRERRARRLEAHRRRTEQLASN